MLPGPYLHTWSTSFALSTIQAWVTLEDNRKHSITLLGNLDRKKYTCPQMLFFPPRQSLLSNTLTQDTYSVTFDTRKAWGSWEAPSTLQSQEKMSGHTAEPGKSYPELLVGPRSQLPRAVREEGRARTALSVNPRLPLTVLRPSCAKGVETTTAQPPPPACIRIINKTSSQKARYMWGLLEFHFRSEQTELDELGMKPLL